MRNQKGFTLIELVFVIVILGILAAFAVPKFVDLTTDARKSTVNGLLGTVRASAEQVKAAAIATQKDDNASTDTPAPTVIVENATVATNYGYPTATAAGIEVIVTQSGEFTVAHAAGVTTWSLTDADTPANCKVTYDATGLTAQGTRPTVATVVTGC